MGESEYVIFVYLLIHMLVQLFFVNSANLWAMLVNVLIEKKLRTFVLKITGLDFLKMRLASFFILCRLVLFFHFAPLLRFPLNGFKY